MNFKKIIAAIAAAAMAVTMTAVSVFAESVYNDTLTGVAQEVDASSWTTLYDGVSTTNAVSTHKDKALVIFADGDMSAAFLKVAGNANGSWSNGTEGNIDSTWAEYYDTATKSVSVPYTIWSKFETLQIGIEHCTVYGAAFEDETATIDAIKALAGVASAPAETEAPAAETTAEETTAAPAETEAKAEETTVAETTAATEETTAAETTAAEAEIDDEDVTVDADEITADDEASEETAPEADETTEAAATGNVAVAAIASVMAVAGAVAIVSKKRN